jgi:TRAP-type C4-dicarboxylate transport system permease small subunit
VSVSPQASTFEGARAVAFIQRVIDAITTVLAGIAAVAMLLLMVHVTIDVVLRYLFNSPPPGTIAFVSNYYMVIASAFPLALVERQKAHISVEAITERLPREVQRHLYGWLLLVSAVVYFMVTYASSIEAMNQMRLNRFSIEGSYRITLWYGYFAVPIGYGFGAVYLLLNWVRYLLGDRAATRSGTTELVS